MKSIKPIFRNLFAATLTMMFSCTDLVQVDPPRTDLIKSTVFASDQTATSAVLDLYFPMRSQGFASGSFNSISFFSTMSSDEQISYFVSSPLQVAHLVEMNENTITPANQYVLGLWRDMYKTIYKANAILEGLQSSTTLTPATQSRLSGEAKFIRAFSYFYLINLFGDVPLVLTTDYQENQSIPRTPVPVVYQQILSDLTEAQQTLPENYSAYNNERVRPIQLAATALLARVHLFNGNYSEAEAMASSVIAASSMFQLVSDHTLVMRKNSLEAIWQVWNDSFPQDLLTFYTFSRPNYGALRSSFLTDFSPTDKRRTLWIGTSGTYTFSKKYAAFQPVEYSTILRFAEQYLIRAEARARLNNIAGAQADLNQLRTRSGLPPTPASDQNSLISAIQQERKFELFNEWGHRWLDLKRFNLADAVLAPIKPKWQPTATLYPIPEFEIINNPALTQNPGY